MPDIDLQVNASSDDGYEYEDSGGVHLTSAVAYIISSADVADRRWGACRLCGTLPPNGATIHAAYATIYVESATYDDINVDIYAEDAAAPATLTTSAGDITDRPLTTASAAWVADSIGTGWVQSPSLVDVIQEIVSGYTPAAVALIFKPRSDATKYVRIRQQDRLGNVWGVKLHLAWSESPGDVDIKGDYFLGDKGRGSPRVVCGTVQLDGTNPTPIALTHYYANILESPIHAICSMEGETSPNLDPSAITSAVSGVTINVYAWKVNDKDNCTFVASTNEERLVNWLALGPSA